MSCDMSSCDAMGRDWEGWDGLFYGCDAVLTVVRS